MNDISKKIYDFLLENGIHNNEVINTLKQSTYDIENNLFENIQLSINMFLSLKDIIWFNLEHVVCGGEIDGLSTLRFFGSKFPFFMNCCLGNNIIDNNIQELLNEINVIISQWNKDLLIVSLYSNSQDDFIFGGDEASKIFIYDGYQSNLPLYGQQQKHNIKKVNDKTKENAILCQKQIKIGEYAQFNILFNILIQLRNACNKAIQNDKGIRINFIEDNSGF